MGLGIENRDIDMKYSIPLHADKESLIFHLRALADELEKKKELTGDESQSLHLETVRGYETPFLNVIVPKRIPFDRIEYMACNTLEELFEAKRKRQQEK